MLFLLTAHAKNGCNDSLLMLFLSTAHAENDSLDTDHQRAPRIMESIIEELFWREAVTFIELQKSAKPTSPAPSS
ncbi:hypothetical protein PUN28_008803 [Cardiocondyla obscurior]|uniref:Secreted protein n=1 Tax=Cardiocondyla obscurior TaxID=286306 RepID=A0AAW2FP03_9HYME